MAAPCTNNPDEVISKIVDAKANADKFDSFVNGTDTETVQLGTGEATPVIRNVVRQMFSAAAELPNSDVSGKFATANGGAVMRTLAMRFSDVVNVKDYGAKGDGETDDTVAIHAAIATGKSVFFPSTDSYYLISDEIGPKHSGQILFGLELKRGMIRNTINDKPLVVFGDAAADDGFCPRSGIRNLGFSGNEDTTAGIVVPSASSSYGNANWTDACKDCILDNVIVEDVGSGWGFEVYSWCNNLNNITVYDGCEKGVLLAVEANQNVANGIYITGCADTSLQIGTSDQPMKNRGNVINGVVAQQSGGTDGVVVVQNSENTSITGLYSEANNSKGAVNILNIKNTAQGTSVNSVNHLSGGNTVILNAGLNTSVCNVVSSNVSSAIVSSSGSGFYGVNVGFASSVTTPTGAVFNDAAGDGILLNGNTLTGFNPQFAFKDMSSGIKDVRFKYDQSVLYLQYDSAGDSTFASNIYRVNAAAPEFVFNSLIRPEVDNSFNIGSGTRRFATVYAGTGMINTSDAREKTILEAPAEALLRAWGHVGYSVFQFNDAIAKKGEAARLHVGVVAQAVQEAFASEGLDASRYGLFCYDRWDADESSGIEAGDRYGIRYGEALALECAYQRWLGEKRDARIAELEARLNELSGNIFAPSGASPDNL